MASVLNLEEVSNFFEVVRTCLKNICCAFSAPLSAMLRCFPCSYPPGMGCEKRLAWQPNAWKISNTYFWDRFYSKVKARSGQAYHYTSANELPHLLPKPQVWLLVQLPEQRPLVGAPPAFWLISLVLRFEIVLLLRLSFLICFFILFWFSPYPDSYRNRDVKK